MPNFPAHSISEFESREQGIAVLDQGSFEPDQGWGKRTSVAPESLYVVSFLEDDHSILRFLYTSGMKIEQNGPLADRDRWRSEQPGTGERGDELRKGLCP